MYRILGMQDDDGERLSITDLSPSLSMVMTEVLPPCRIHTPAKGNVGTGGSYKSMKFQ